MTPDERREYQRAWRAANADKLAAYKERHEEARKAAAKARYLQNREAIIARTRAWQAANPEKAKAAVQRGNAKAAAMNKDRVTTAKRLFDLLPEEQREEYAHWLLLLADLDTSYAGTVRNPSLDYGYIGVYSGL